MKQKLFITFILCLWLPVVYATGSHNLLPWPQQVDWTKQAFSGKALSLSLAGNTEQMVTDWLQESNIKVNPASKKVFRVTLVASLPEAKINENEAYKLQVSPQGITIEATTEQGVYRAIQTLRQLTDKKGDRAYITSLPYPRIYAGCGTHIHLDGGTEAGDSQTGTIQNQRIPLAPY